jgi:glutathione S-transferase
MKIYGDLISPFVRMTIVTAHEVGLGGKVQHIVEPVKPTEVNARLSASLPSARSRSWRRTMATASMIPA